MSYIGKHVICHGTGFRYSGYTAMADVLGLTKWDHGGDKNPIGMSGIIISEHPHLSKGEEHKILVGVDFGKFQSIFGMNGTSLEIIRNDLFVEDFTL